MTNKFFLPPPAPASCFLSPGSRLLFFPGDLSRLKCIYKSGSSGFTVLSTIPSFIPYWKPKILTARRKRTTGAP